VKTWDLSESWESSAYRHGVLEVLALPELLGPRGNGG
jgi:hypothetical protein